MDNKYLYKGGTLQFSWVSAQLYTFDLEGCHIKWFLHGTPGGFMKHILHQLLIDVQGKQFLSFYKQCVASHKKAKEKGWEPAYDGPEKEPDENQ